MSYPDVIMCLIGKISLTCMNSKFKEIHLKIAETVKTMSYPDVIMCLIGKISLTCMNSKFKEIHLKMFAKYVFHSGVNGFRFILKQSLGSSSVTVGEWVRWPGWLGDQLPVAINRPAAHCLTLAFPHRHHGAPAYPATCTRLLGWGLLSKIHVKFHVS